METIKMETIKIIDLLNKIANGETPKEIYFEGYKYKWHGYDSGYCRSVEGSNWISINTDFNLIKKLRDEVEIIKEEEKKIPEKLYFHDLENITENEKILVFKINSMLDYLESKEKGE